MGFIVHDEECASLFFISPIVLDRVLSACDGHSSSENLRGWAVGGSRMLRPGIEQSNNNHEILVFGGWGGTLARLVV